MGEYRYGFNGKENDNEVKGEGNQQDYGMRVYDPRVGKFLSVDPLSPQYPHYTPYQFAGNMPIRAIDLDGGEANLRYTSEGIFGIGLFDPMDIGSLTRHKASLRIGKGDKQFKLQWLLSDNGNVIGYLASRIIPEGEYKDYYGGDGDGLQEAFVIDRDKFGEFARNTDKYYDKSRNAELYDVMYGEIERDPVKSMFDPRYLLLARVGGVAGSISRELFGLLPTLSRMRMIVAVQKVTRHLVQFGDDAGNKIMLDRLNKIAKGELQATEIDKAFMKHELREAELMKSGMKYDPAHEQTLKEQGMYERGYEKKLYTPEALEAQEIQFRKEFEQ